MDKKYELIPLKEFNNKRYRIRALVDGHTYKKGDFGGIVSSEYNLSQKGKCWITKNVFVGESARVYGNAFVNGFVHIFGKARIFGNANVGGCVNIYDNVKIYGKTLIYCDGSINDNVNIYDEAKIMNNYINLHGDLKIHGKVFIKNPVLYIDGDAEIKEQKDYLVFKTWWANAYHTKYITWTRSNDIWSASPGNGCLEENKCVGLYNEFLDWAYKKSEIYGKGCESFVKYVESIKEFINKIK